MSRQKKLSYELISNEDGRVLASYPDRTTGLRLAYQFLVSYPEHTAEVSFLVLERGSGTVRLTLSGQELRQVCEDESIEIEDELGYEE